MEKPEGPLLAVWLLFLGIVFLRTQATYWIARVVTSQALSHTAPEHGWRASVHRWLEGTSARRGRDLVQRWGLIAVPLSFLTVGAQTVVNAAAGVIRMPAWQYTLVMIPGCMAWALVWTTIGMSAFYAAIAAGLTTGWGIAAALAAVLAVAAVVGWRRRRIRPH
ncbi:VTT domain-containing protein [Nocardioides sp. AE5]|uniref:VTT domain-containing protein n=1 Tax=Nocardioides sp. AE5 TaxID=2962573 RepID=UPI002880E119|nr:VTT domain-containing protein [Nocardioides sp. AE5]MDT0202799.1 VTT domain-containing protein [Nocardioides sp. AE5]